MAGRHIVILMDSLTRMGRAFNRSRRHSNSGRTMTGGIDSRALEVPKQVFGSARNTEEAGSLTIIASCLVDTGSQGDQVIFEEFKGTGNMELIHVAGALELLEDHLVALAPRVHEAAGDDGEGAGLLGVAGAAEDLLGDLQGAAVDAAGHGAPGVGVAAGAVEGAPDAG